MEPVAVLAERARRDGAGPLVTFYDDATGERVELSGITTLNWVAKVCALLREELWVEPGAPVGIDLPLHWQRWVITLAVWAAGATPADHGEVELVEAGAASTARDVVALSLRPLGGRILGELPPGWLDFAAVVPGQPDALDAVTPAVNVPDPPVLPAGARVLATDWDVRLVVLAPLACGGSVVLVRHPRADLGQLADTERVSHTVGCTVGGRPRVE